MAGRTIRVEVVGDNRGLKAALKDSEASLKGLEGAAAKSQTSLSRIDKGFQLFSKGAAIAAGATAVTAAIKDVVDSASRLEQSQGAIQAVFGSTAKEMQVAAEAASELGLSTAAYGEVASKLGSQLKNQGVAQGQIAGQTQELIKLSTDLAATYGGDVTQAVDAVSALFRGETDPIERYGISIKQAQVSALAAAEGISEVAARTKLLYEQSSSAQGQWNREQDTFAVKSAQAAASFENLKASLGEALLPILGQAADLLRGLAEVLNLLPDGVKQGAVQIAAAVVAYKLWTIAIGRAQTALAGLLVSQVASAQGLGASATAAAAASAQKWASRLQAVGVAAVVVGIAYSKMKSIAQEAAGTVEEFVDQLEKAGEAGQVTFARDSFFDANLGVGIQGVTQDFDDLDEVLQRLSSSQIERIVSDGGLFDVFRDDTGIRNYVEALTQLAAIDPSRAAAELGVLQEKFAELGLDTDLLDPAVRALEEAGYAAEGAGPPVSDLASNFEALAEAVDRALGPLQEMAGIQLDASKAARDVAAALQKAREASEGVTNIWDAANKTFRVATEEQRKLGEALDAVADTGLEASVAIGRDQGWKAAVENTRKVRAAYIELANDAGVPIPVAKRLADALGLIPDQVKTNLKTEGVPKVITDAQRVEDALAAVEGTYTASIVINTSWSAPSFPTSPFGVQPVGVQSFGVQSAAFGDAAASAVGGQSRGIYDGGGWLEDWLFNPGKQQAPRVLDLEFNAKLGGNWELVSDTLEKIRERAKYVEEELKMDREEAELARDRIDRLSELSTKWEQFEGKRKEALQSIRRNSKENKQALKDETATLEGTKKLARENVKSLADGLDAIAKRQTFGRAMDNEGRRLLADLKENFGIRRKDLGLTVKELRAWKDNGRLVLKNEERITDAIEKQIEWREERLDKAKEDVQSVEDYYQTVKKVLDQVKAAYDSVVSATAGRILGGLNIGTAWATATAKSAEKELELENLLKDARKDSWNPRIVAEWDAAVVKARAELDQLQAGEGAGLESALDKQAADTKKFVENLRGLQASGALSPEALQQIVGLGVEGGKKLAAALADDPGLAAIYSQTFASIGELAADFGTEVADYSYAGILQGLQDAKDETEEFFRKNPIRTKAVIEAVFVDEDGNKIKFKGRGKNGLVLAGASGARTVNVNVRGNLVDPVGAGFAMRDAIREVEKVEGVSAW